MSTTAPATTQQRFESALGRVRAQGVTVTLNVMTCCRGCTGAGDLGFQKDTDLDTVSYLWTYGGQGCETAWRNGVLCRVERDDRECECYTDEDEYDEDEDGNEVLTYEGEGEVECALCREGERGPRYHPVSDLHFYHGGKGNTARLLVEAIRMEGLEAEWDGTEHQAVKVVF